MPSYEIDGMIPVIDPTAFVHDTASIIGDVWIGPGCYIGPHASLRADFGRIVIGEGSNVQDSCVIHAYPAADVVLAPHSHIGHAAVLHGCTVGSYAMVGINAVVLDGAEIGEGALLGANSLLTAGRSIAPNTLAHGSPAKEVGQLDEQMLAWKRRGVGIYEELARRSVASLRRVDPLETDSRDRRRLFQEGPAPAIPPHLQ